MSAKLNLIKNSSPEHLKARVVLPNFPFSYLAFKCHGTQLAFEVTDVSYTGMQVALKNGEHQHQGTDIEGELHWNGESLKVTGTTKWKTPRRMGIEFSTKLQENVRHFFSLPNMVKHVRAVHKMDIPMEFPVKLKYWLRGDGPLELFVWQHNDAEFSKFQFLMMEHYIEWIDGEGLKTGKLFSKRDLKTPMIDEDEFTFVMDEGVSQKRLDFAAELLQLIDDQLLPSEVREFLSLKLRH